MGVVVTIALSLITFLAIWLSQSILKEFLLDSKLKRLPTPKKNLLQLLFWPAVGDLPEYLKFRHSYLTKCHEVLGDTFRLWRGGRLVVMCRDVDVVKQVLTSKQSFVKDTNVWSNSSLNALFSGPRWTEVANLVQPFVGETLFTTDGESWKVQRSAINCLFSSKFVCQLEQKLSEFSFNIVDRWAKDIATSSQDVVVRDILPDVHDMTLDAIISVVVGCSRKELDEIKPRWGQRLFSTFRKSLSAFVQN